MPPPFKPRRDEFSPSDTPQRRTASAFRATPSTVFAGETPYRPNRDLDFGSSVASPFGEDDTPSRTFRREDSRTDEDGEYDEDDEVEGDELMEEEGEEEPPRQPVGSTGPFSFANVAKKGIPEGGKYTFDPNDLHYAPTGGDHQYSEESEEGDYDREGDDGTMRDDEINGSPIRNKSPISKEQFITTNPPTLLIQSNNLLTSLVRLFSPPEDSEETGLPYSQRERETSPGRQPLTTGKRAQYLAKHVSVFLTTLQTSANIPALEKAYYITSLLLNLHHPTPANKSPSQLEIYKQWLSNHHPYPTIEDLQGLHIYHPTPCASPNYWDIITHLTLRGEVIEVQSLLTRGGWDKILAEGARPGQNEEYKYSDEDISVIQRVLNVASKMVASCPPLFSKVSGSAGSAREHERYAEWRIYRGRVTAAVEELKTLSHSSTGDDQAQDAANENDDNAEWVYETVTTTKGGFAKQTVQKRRVPKPNRNMNIRGLRQPTAKIPFDIEAGLMALYSILGGKFDEILACSERWEEAVCGVALWRRYIDEEDEEDDRGLGDEMLDDATGFGRNLLGRGTLLGRGGSLRGNSARNANRGPRQARQRRGVTIAAENGLEVLKTAFRRVTRNDLLINTTSQREVALAAVLQGDWKGVVDALISKEWGAYAVADFVVELARLAEWSVEDCDYGDGNPSIGLGSLLSGFRDDDWNVFAAGGRTEGATNGTEVKDKRKAWEEDIIHEYIMGLVELGKISAGVSTKDKDIEMDIDESSQHQSTQQPAGETEGWELAMQVLNRWSTVNGSASLEWVRDLAGEILTQLPHASTQTVDKILMYCEKWDLTHEATSIAGAYADQLRQQSCHGDALVYYSRSKNRTKLHEILAKLISKSLLLSTSYPPQSQLDPTFRKILDAPTEEEDEMLRYELSGYAALRRFYEARDQGNMEVAAKTIVALIRSAGEMVDGGRGVDEEWESPVEWWVTGVLIGEVLMFLNQSTRHLPLRSTFDILKVLQDLTSSGPPALSPTEEFLRKALLAYKSPRDIPLLLKSRSTVNHPSTTQPPNHITDSNNNNLGHMGDFSLTGSSMFGSWEQVKRSTNNLRHDPASSGMLVDHPDDHYDQEGEEGVDQEEQEFYNTYIDNGMINEDEKRKKWDWRQGMVEIVEMEGNAGVGGSGKENGTTPAEARGVGDAARYGVLETVLRIARMGFAREIGRAWLEGEES